MDDRLNHKLVELFYSISSGNLFRLKNLLKNTEDNKQLLKSTKKTGETLLIAAVEEKSLEAVSILIRRGASVKIQHTVNKNYPIDIAWKNCDYAITLELLQAGSIFPKQFDRRPTNFDDQSLRDIEAIVKSRIALHQAIQQGSLATVQATLKNSVPSEHYFNLKNDSALGIAAKLIRPEIYAYLLSIGARFKNNQESISIFKTLSPGQKEDLRTSLLPYFKNNDKSHLLYLLSKSKSSTADTSFQTRCEQYYNKLNRIPEISLIMQVMQYADHNNIIFYPGDDAVDPIDPSGALGDGGTRGTTQMLEGTIYIAEGAPESEILENLAHEFTHRALSILYENRGYPYFSELGLLKEDLENLLSKIKEPVNKEYFCVLISKFLKNYSDDLHPAEIFPFFSELLLEPSKKNGGSSIKTLEGFYNERLVKACNGFIEIGHLTKPRSNIIAIEKFAGESSMLELSHIVLSKNKIKIDILTTVSKNANKNIALITTNNLRLSSHKLYQEIQATKDYLLPGRYLLLKFTRFKLLAVEVHEVFSSKMNPLLIIVDPQGIELEEPLRKLSESLSSPSKKIILLLKPQEVDSIKKTLNQLELQNSYVEITDETYTWEHLTPASRKKLLNKRCLFQGIDTPLYQLLEKKIPRIPIDASQSAVSDQRKLFNPLTTADLKELLTPEILPSLLSSQKPTIGKPFPLGYDPESLFYEPRTLQRTAVINPQSLLVDPLEQSDQDRPIFVISSDRVISVLPIGVGYPFTEASQGLPLTKHYFFILLENSAVEEQWSQLCQRYPSHTLHWLRESRGILTWQRSQGSFSSLQPYIDHSHPVDYDEGLFTEGEIAQKLFILADDPLLGKTSFLHNLAPNFKAAYGKSWVISLTLNDYSKQFKTYQAGPQGGNYNSQQAIDFLSDTLLQLTSPLEKAIFKNRLRSSTGVSLLLDGLDDLSPEYKKTAVNFLKSLRNTQLDTLWITTRTHLKQELETQFNEMAYTLKPLSEIEAYTLLSRIWRSTVPAQSNDKKILIYATYLVKKFKELLRLSSSGFIGSPLLLQLLSTAYKLELQQFLESPNPIPESNTQFSLTALYKQLIEKKLAIYFDNKLKLDSSNMGILELRQSQTISLQQAHQRQALQQLFPEISALAPAHTFTDEALARGGLLKLTDAGLKFIHPTIAEYYAAGYFAAQLSTAHPPPAVVNQFLTQLLTAPQHQIVRLFLNDWFIQDKPSFTQLWSEQRLQQAVQGEHPLSLSAVEGDTAILDYLQTSLGLFPKHEFVKPLVLARGVQGRTCLHQAVLSGTPETVDHIVELAHSLGATQDLAFLADQKGNTALHQASQLPQEGIAKNVLKHLELTQKVKLLQTKNLRGRTALQVAALYNSVAVARALLGVLGKEHYAYVAISDHAQQNALRNALSSPGDKLELIKVLLSPLSDPECQTLILASDSRGTNSVHDAIDYQHITVTPLLLSYVGDSARRILLLSRDTAGNTVLHRVAERGERAMADVLLDNAGFLLQKEMLLAKATNGKTAEELARSNHQDDLAAFLRLTLVKLPWENYRANLKGLGLSSVEGANAKPRCRRRLGGCSRTVIDDPLLYDARDPAKAIEAPLLQANDYAQLAIAVAWEQPQIFSNPSQESILEHQRLLASLLKATSDNRSPEGQSLVENYSQRVSDLLGNHPSAALWQPLTADDSGHATARCCWRFDNGQTSLLVRFDGQRYQLYSADFKEPQHFQTAIGATFAEVETFAQALLLWRSGKPSYQRSVLKKPLPTALLTHFKEAPLWRVDSLQPKAPQAIANIEGLPVQTLRELFYLNGKIPDYSALNAQFFQSSNPLQFRADRLHEVLPDLDDAQRQALSRLARRHHWSVTASKTPSAVQFTHVDEADYPKLLTAYQQRVMTLLEQPDPPTLEQLSQLSWDQLADYGTAHPEISEDLMRNSLETLQDFQASATVYKSLVSKETAAQSLFFLPDFIRAANTGESANLRKMLVMTASDTTINHVYHPLLNKLSPRLSPARRELLGRVGSSPIFKILTLYSIKELLQKQSSLPPNSPERQAIKEALDDQYLTIGIMVAECLGIATTPAWISLFVDQWLNSANHFRHDQHLDVSLWEALLMELGFKQDKVQTLFRERQLVTDEFSKILAFNAYYDSPYDYVMATVPLLQPLPWETINEQRVPAEIRVQLNQGQEIVGGFRKAIFPSAPSLWMPLNKIYSWQQLPYQTTAAETTFTIPLQPHYSRPYFPVISLSDLLPESLKPYNETVLALNPILQFFSKFLPPSTEPGSIFLPITPENFTHYHPLISTEFPIDYVKKFPIKITGSRPAAFYSTQLNYSAGIIPKKLFFHLDPREGNVAINTFTSPWVHWAAQQPSNHLLNINSRSRLSFTLFIDNKPYPEPIRFQKKSTPSRVSIQDDSGLLTTNYLIRNSTNLLLVDDTAASAITFIHPDNSTTLSISSDLADSSVLNIRYQPVSRHTTSSPDNKLHFIGNKQSLQLNLQDVIVDRFLELRFPEVEIMNVQGRSNFTCWVSFTPTVKTFNITLQGNILIESDKTQLKVSGLIATPHHPIRFFKHPAGQQKTTYTLMVDDLVPPLQSLSSQAYPSLRFSLETVTCTWKIDPPINAQLQIIGSWHNASAEFVVQAASDRLTVYNQQHRPSSISLTHYPSTVRLPAGLRFATVLHPAQLNDSMRQLTTSNLHQHARRHQEILVFHSLEGYPIYHQFILSTGTLIYNNIPYRLREQRLYGLLDDQPTVEAHQLLRDNSPEQAVVPLYFSKPLGSSNISLFNGSLIINGVPLQGLPNESLIYFGNPPAGFPVSLLKKPATPLAVNTTDPASNARQRRQATEWNRMEPAPASSAGNRLMAWPTLLLRQLDTIARSLFQGSHVPPLHFSPPLPVATTALQYCPKDSVCLDECFTWTRPVERGDSGDPTVISGATCRLSHAEVQLLLQQPHSHFDYSEQQPKVHYSKHSCSPLTWYQQPSVSCQNGHSTFIYTPELPPPLEQLDGCQFMLLAVGWHWLEKNLQVFQNQPTPPAVSSPLIEITDGNIRAWQHQLTQLQQSLSTVKTFCKNHATLQTLFAPLPHWLKELQEIWETFSPRTEVALERVTEFTDRLTDLTTELNEFKITQAIFGHLDSSEENCRPISIASTVTKIREIHHLIQELTNVVEADPLFATHRLEQEIVNLTCLIQAFQSLGIEPSVSYGLQSMMQELTGHFSYLVRSPKGG